MEKNFFPSLFVESKYFGKQTIRMICDVPQSDRIEASNLLSGRYHVIGHVLEATLKQCGKFLDPARISCFVCLDKWNRVDHCFGHVQIITK